MTHDEILFFVKSEVEAVNASFRKWLSSGELNGEMAHDLAAAFTAGWMNATDALINDEGELVNQKDETEKELKELKEAIIWINGVIKDAYKRDIFDLLMALDTDGQFYDNREDIEILRELLRKVI